MKVVRLLFTIFIASLASFAALASGDIAETVSYDVMYKWGLINTKAGTARITIYSDPHAKTFDAILTASSAKWADRYFTLRDTLMGTMDKSTLQPTYYEKIAHEGGAYQRDILRYSRQSNEVTATVQLWRRGKKETDVRRLEDRVHQANGLTMDMLSAFYYMRGLSFENMKPGESVSFNVFSGTKIEKLTIHYKGLDHVKLDDKNYKCYHVTFTFTTGGGKTSSDNLDAWIECTPSRIPLLLEGKLPVGKVRALYTGYRAEK